MGKHLWSGGIHHQIWARVLQKEVVFLINISRLSGSTTPRSYWLGHASEIEAGEDSNQLCQSEGANFGDDSAYYGGS